MRLTCPNCSAQYEVPDEVIPEEGRDVQCSNCDQTWFQAKHPAEAAGAPDEKAETPEKDDASPDVVNAPQDAEPEPVEEAVSEDKPEVDEPAATTGSVDPSVASILKEEAAREAELRAQEGSSLESQPDLGLDTPPEPPEPKVRPKRPSASETAVDAGQKDALPDVEAINSTMRSDESEEAPQPPRKSGGFLRGFALMLIIGVVLYLIYGNAQQISDAVPQADPLLSSYVSLVDQARIWLEAQAGSGAQN
ncbi:zinc-ribbon domain-containing protein [Ruegeria sp. YS9]|uniref:zinc-ribbon domain-containing protein n=1 Tax=Ruegeria sp. YS9 TaxID=2966453 RepID=UPI00214BABB2|nr:zinc-ribbon domain-containing protein [Ruegeria sp. YS9]UUV06339.1 zinc-ribbon domain-containing protein [Ruegeria sp. YS9]